MPQLNPSPWFIILMFTWFILTVLIMPKMTSYKTPNETHPQDVKTLKTTTWSWQWH